MRIDGWLVRDQGYRTREAEPRWVIQYQIEKDGWTITVHDMGCGLYEVRNGSRVHKGLSETAANVLLRSYRAPTIPDVLKRQLSDSLKGAV